MFILLIFIFNEHMQRRLRVPLTVKVFPSAIVSLQQCALYLLLWTKELTGNSGE